MVCKPQFDSAQHEPVTRGGSRTGLLAIALILAVALAVEPVLADGKGRSGKGGSGASGRSGKDHSGNRHSGKHPHRSRSSADAGFVWAPVFWPWWNYPPYYPVVAMAPVPLAYIERSEQEAQPVDHWLYCAKAQGYFPHVGECPEGWERVPAAPLK